MTSSYSGEADMMRDSDHVLEVNSLLYRKPIAPDLGHGVVVTFKPGPQESFVALIHDGWTRKTSRAESFDGYPAALKDVIRKWRITRVTLAQLAPEEEN